MVASDDFNEEQYLRANPDVAAAVKRGEERSGRDHYVRCGKDEGRRLAPPPQQEPHYIAEYRELVSHLSSHHDRDEAMSLSVGGNYDLMGTNQVDLLVGWGLRDGHGVIDIGCGSGRFAHAARKRNLRIDYLGTDVIPDLLAYARTKAPANFRFTLHTELTVPSPDASADFVMFFSVFTHLFHEESFAYLRDAVRAVKPGGAVIFSFVESRLHWNIFVAAVERRLTGTAIETTMFIERPMIEAWAEQLGLRLEAYRFGPPLGQSAVLLRKP